MQKYKRAMGCKATLHKMLEVLQILIFDLHCKENNMIVLQIDKCYDKVSSTFVTLWAKS